MKLAADKIDPAPPVTKVTPNANTRESRTSIEGAQQTSIDHTSSSPTQAEIDAAAARHQADMDAAKKAADTAAIANGTMGSGPNGAFVPGDPGYKPNNGGGGGGKNETGRIVNSDGSTTIIYSDGSHDLIPSNVPTGVGQSAKDIVNSFLAQAGMAPLTDQVWAQWGAGTSAPQILDYIRSTPEYATRYPAMKALNARGMNITEGQYANIEQSYTNQLKSFGIPSGVFDTHAYMGSLIENNVTPADLQTRLNDAQSTILSHDANTIKYAQDTFGLTTGDLMAGYLDPKLALPTVEQNSKAMQIGGAALGSGFQGQGVNGEITKAQADQLATQGISQAQALQGFGNLGQQTQFGMNLPGDNSGSLTQQQLIDAQFNSNAASQLALRNLQARRLSDYNQGGQLAQDSKGVSGAGVSNSAT